MESPRASDLSDDESSAAMAAAMGFSAFGSQTPRAKKRKFNPSTDAFVEGQALKNIDKGGRKGQGSGGNTMPLGRIRVLGGGERDFEVGRVAETVREKANEDEINLDDGDDLGGDDIGPQYIDTSQPAPADIGGRDGPQYIDTSEPPPTASSKEADEMQRRIDAILARIQPDETPTQAPVAGQEARDLPPPPSLEDIQSGPHIHGLPQRLNSRGQGGVRGRGGAGEGYVRGGGAGQGRGRGQRNEKWYEGYYDRSFNENPWERLEKERGLQPLGKWPETI